ncbi:MAG TPA: MFS transporter [Gammaproteobacteria bacterium]|nr:MFS transporter [Gammaproteobacteria bacterium]
MSTSKIFYGHYIVGASMVTQMMYLGLFFTFGVLFPEFENEFGWSRAQISGASSTMFAIMGVLGIAMGRVNDRVGPRILLAVSTVVFALGFILMSRMTSIWHLYLFYGLFCGLGIAAHDVVTLSTVARWFERSRGLMSGLVKTGAGIGQLIVPLLASFLVIHYGWREASMVVGVVALIVMLVAAQVMRRDPMSLGLKPWGGEQKDQTGTDITQEMGVGLKQALRTRQFWLISMAKLADWYCLFTVIIHIVPHGIDQGLEPATAATLLSVIGGCSILGRVTLGAAFDVLGAKWSLTIAFVLLFLSVLFLQLLPGPSWLFAFALIYGIAHGGFFAVASPSVAEYFGTRSHGVIFGIVMFVGSIGGTVGPWLTGWIYDLMGTYDIAFLLVTGFSVFGLLMALGLKPITSCMHGH